MSHGGFLPPADGFPRVFFMDFKEKSWHDNNWILYL